MKIEETNKYKEPSISELLAQQISQPSDHLCQIIYGKIFDEQCTPQILQMTFMLYDRDYNRIEDKCKWLKVIERFSQLKFKSTFSFCLERFNTHHSQRLNIQISLLPQVIKQGTPEELTKWQRNIEHKLDICFSKKDQKRQNLNLSEIWKLYIKYLSNCFKQMPSRTMFALQNMQQRFNQSNNKQDHIYRYIEKSQKVELMHVIIQIIAYYEIDLSRKLKNLNQLFTKIPNIVNFLEKQLIKETNSYRCMKLFITIENIWSDSQDQRNKQIELILAASKVSFLRKVIRTNAQRIAIQLKKLRFIQYQGSQMHTVFIKQDRLMDNIKEEFNRQDSLINHIQSDDTSSLLQQLLTTLSSPSLATTFLKTFIEECFAQLGKKQLPQVKVTDLVLKLCILSKQITQYLKIHSQSLSIKQIINKLYIRFESTSILMKIRIVKMIHYFKQILNYQDFKKYYQPMFKAMKKFLIEKCKKYNKQVFDFQSHNRQASIELIHSKIEFVEYIKILEEQTQKNAEEQNNRRINKKNNFRISNIIQKQDIEKQDIEKNKNSWIFDQVKQLLMIEGDCDDQQKLYCIIVNLIETNKMLVSESDLQLIQLFSDKFMKEYKRLQPQTQHHKKNYSKAFVILKCIEISLPQIREDKYYQCQKVLTPVIQLLQHRQGKDFHEQIIKLIPLLMRHAKKMTQSLNQFIKYSQYYWGYSNRKSIQTFDEIIRQLSKQEMVKSVSEIQEYQQLLKFYPVIFGQYINQAKELDIIQTCQRQWLNSVHLIQLLLQSFQLLYCEQRFSQMVNQLTKIIQILPINEQSLQLRMTIHHFSDTSQMYPCPPLFNRALFKEKYSLNIIQLTLTDSLVNQIINKKFDLNDKNNEVHRFLSNFSDIRKWKQNVQLGKVQNILNDLLPYNYINIDKYLSDVINDLVYKFNVIGITEKNKIKNRLAYKQYPCSK